MRNRDSDKLPLVSKPERNNLQLEFATWGLRLKIGESAEGKSVDLGATQTSEAQFIGVQIVSGIGLIFAVAELTGVRLSGSIK